MVLWKTEDNSTNTFECKKDNNVLHALYYMYLTWVLRYSKARDTVQCSCCCSYTYVLWVFTGLSMYIYSHNLKWLKMVNVGLKWLEVLDSMFMCKVMSHKLNSSCSATVAK